MTLGKLRLSAGTKVLEQPRPGLQAGPLDDPLQLRAQIAVRFPVPRNAVDRSRFGFLEGRHQVGFQLRKHRDQSKLMPFVVFGLGTVNQEPARLPIHVFPLQRQDFRRTSKAPISAQRKEQPPLSIRAGVKDFPSIRVAHKVESVIVAHGSRFQILKGIRCDDLLLDRHPEKDLGVRRPLADRGRTEALTLQVSLPLLSIVLGDFLDRFVGPEELDQRPARVPVDKLAVRFQVVSISQIALQEFAKAALRFRSRPGL